MALLLGLPAVLMVLLRYVLNSEQRFTAVAPALLGVFPCTIMFLLTSVSTLRERTSGTLERLMTLPLGRLDLLGGYALAFGLLAVIQVAVAAGVSLWWLGLTVSGPLWGLLLITVLDALLGVALGLCVSALARTEFQAVQFMPVFILPQILLCGLFVPRGEMGWLLAAVSDVMPLSYAVDALDRITRSTGIDGIFVRDTVIVAACATLVLVIGAATLRRRTP